MKVVRLQEPRKLAVVEEPVPEIGPDEALIKIEAVGICGSDLHRFRGHFFEQEKCGAEIILGHEFTATVAKVGRDVRHLQPGHRVAVEAGRNCGKCEWCERGDINLCPHIQFCGAPPTDGALREYMAWPARLLFPLPDELSFDDGVLAEITGICLHSIDLANMRPGLTAAVLGSGPVGLTTVHLLRKVVGASQIFATDLLPYRLQAVLNMGADVVVNAADEDVTSRIMERTNGRGVDVVFEAAGVDETSIQSVEIAAPGGHVIIIGIPENDRTPFSSAPARRKGLTFRFVRRSKLTYPRGLALAQNRRINLKAMVTHHFPLDQTEKAFDIVDHYKDGVIKAIVNP